MISVRLNPDIEKELKDIAEFEGMNVSEFVRSIIIEKMEDMYDIKVADEAYQEFKENPEDYSFEEVMEKLSL